MRRKARVTGLKMIWVGDLNVNPNKEDCSPGVWDHLQGKLKGRIPGGCRMIDVKTYRQNVAAIDGVNLAEYFHPGTEIPKTHYCNDISRKHGIGQRIDHIIVQKTMLNGSAGVAIKDFRTLQEFGGYKGSSDHCPIFCQLVRNAISLDKTKEVSQLDTVEIYNISTGVLSRTAFRNQPICTMLIQNQRVDCLFDSGSCFSIFNPLKGMTIFTDPLIRTMRHLSAEQILLRGMCGLMRSRNAVVFTIRWSSEQFALSQGIVLDKHVVGFPRVVLGRETMFRDLGGVCFAPVGVTTY